MAKVDRRIGKTQEAIKTAFLELMAEKNFDQITIQDISDRANVSRRTVYLHYLDKYDLLDKLIEEHMNTLRELAEESTEMDFIEGNQIWFQYFEDNYLFFSTMLASKGASSFHRLFLEFVIEGLRDEVDIKKEKYTDLNEDVLLRFIGGAYVELVDWWFANKMPYPPRNMAKQIGVLIEMIV